MRHIKHDFKALRAQCSLGLSYSSLDRMPFDLFGRKILDDPNTMWFWTYFDGKIISHNHQIFGSIAKESMATSFWFIWRQNSKDFDDQTWYWTVFDGKIMSTKPKCLGAFQKNPWRHHLDLFGSKRLRPPTIRCDIGVGLSLMEKS